MPPVEAAELVERIWARDASLWTGSDEARWLGWLDEPSRYPREQMREELAEAARARRLQLRAAGDGRLEPGAGGHAPGRRRGRLPRPRQHAPGRDPLAREPHRPRRHPVHRLVQVGDDARDALPSGLLLAQGRKFRGRHGPRLGARGARPRTRLCGGRLGGADDRRPLLRALAVRPRPGGLMGLDVEQLMEGAAEMQEACRTTGTRASISVLALGHAWLEGRDKVVVPEGNGFGLWLEQLLAESTGKNGKGLVPAPGESPRRGPTGRSARSRSAASGAGRRVLPLGVRHRGRRRRSSDQPLRPAQRAGGEGPHARGPFRPRPGAWHRTRPTGQRRWKSCSPARSPATTSRSWPSSPGRAKRELRPLVERARSDRVRRHRRARPALPALDRPAAQGRPAERRLRPGRGRPGRGAGDPRAAVQLPHPDPRAGRGGPRRPGGARTPYRSRDTRRPGGAMKLGMVGLGRMGANMVERLRQGGHEVETYARTAPERTADSLVELATKLEQPRVVWLMIPAGDPTEKTFQTLLRMLEDGDTVVDGGNSNFRDSIRRAEQAKTKGVMLPRRGRLRRHLGPRRGLLHHGRRRRGAFQTVEPALATLAPGERLRARRARRRGPLREDGAQRHRVRPHAGLRRGLRSAAAHPTSTTSTSRDRRALEARLRRRSWLLELLERALQADPGLEEIRGLRRGLGRGPLDGPRGHRRGVPVPVLALSLFARFSSRQDESFAAKVNAALRNQFGGHAVEAARRRRPSDGGRREPAGSRGSACGGRRSRAR